MKKDFGKWNNKKTEIDHANNPAFYHEREVWWCSTGLNVGFEQDGKGENFSRPVLIVKGFNKNVFLSVPLTTKAKDGKYYYRIDLGDGVSRKIILSQIRLLDSKRLQEKITTINKEQFSEIKKAIIQLLE
ncbi:MAG: type II toxin-antitoxin system PemK/MazF family toxin, partial [Patescibacteria group bacterium]